MESTYIKTENHEGPQEFLVKPYIYYLFLAGDGFIERDNKERYDFRDGTVFCSFIDERIIINSDNNWTIAYTQLDFRKEFRPGFRLFSAEKTCLFCQAFRLALSIQDSSVVFKGELIKEMQSVLSTLAYDIGSRLRPINQNVFDILSTAYENLSDPDFDINEEIRKRNYSEGYLRKQIINECGNTPVKFLNLIRIERAKELMRSTKEKTSIQAIAHQCGFKDPLYFSRMFKKYEGISPKEYSQKAKKEARLLDNGVF